jgi:MoaA/NifB/PqqE/SkfB family radical SAM enzyme
LRTHLEKVRTILFNGLKRNDQGTEQGMANNTLQMIWLELGLECQIECLHCYAGAGPRKGFGTMTTDDWESVVGQAAELGARHV